MRLRQIEAEQFLSVGDRVLLEVAPGLTVITGPNGVGKTNLGACLDLARAVVGRAAGDPAAERLGLYESAGHDGAGSFIVALGLDLDQELERRQVRALCVPPSRARCGMTLQGRYVDHVLLVPLGHAISGFSHLGAGEVVLHVGCLRCLMRVSRGRERTAPPCELAELAV